jgi:hypothetical protein
MKTIKKILMTVVLLSLNLAEASAHQIQEFHLASPMNYMMHAMSVEAVDVKINGKLEPRIRVLISGAILRQASNFDGDYKNIEKKHKKLRDIFNVERLDGVFVYYAYGHCRKSKSDPLIMECQNGRYVRQSKEPVFAQSVEVEMLEIKDPYSGKVTGYKQVEHKSKIVELLSSYLSVSKVRVENIYGTKQDLSAALQLIFRENKPLATTADFYYKKDGLEQTKDKGFF